jgi:urease gamma subunit
VQSKSAITGKTMTELLLEGYELLRKSDAMKGVPRKIS